MPPVRILHLADVHLGKVHQFLPAEKQQRRREELFRTFQEVLEDCLAGNLAVDVVLIAGDLFDSPNPEPRLVEKVQSLFQQLRDAGIAVFLIAGNHDNLISPGSVYRTVHFPGVRFLDSPNIEQPVRMEIKGQELFFYGMSFTVNSRPPFDEFKPVSSNGVHIALLHGSLMNQEEWKLHGQDVPLQLEKLFQTGFDYLALGHYHNFQHYRQGRVQVVYCGSLEPLSWSETSARQLVVVEIEERQVVVKPRLLQKEKKIFRAEQMDVSLQDFQDNRQLAEYLKKQYSDPNAFLKLHLTGTVNFAIEAELLKELLEDYFFHLSLVDATELFRSPLVAAMAEENTIRGLAFRQLLKEIEATSDQDARRQVLEEALKILAHHLS